jgi:hypothetical protein
MMKYLSIAFLVLTAAASIQAFAADPALTPQKQGDVEFVSGGIGAEERSAIRAMQKDYNLHLLFSVKGTGEYASGVKVKIMSKDGSTLLDAVANGPDFLAKLAPGSYKLAADRNGDVLEKSFNVAKGRGASLSLTWSK